MARGLKMFLNGTVRLGLSLVSIQSSVYGATTVAKVSLFSIRIRSTVIFYSVCVEIDLFSCEQTSAI